MKPYPVIDRDLEDALIDLIRALQKDLPPILRSLGEKSTHYADSLEKAQTLKGEREEDVKILMDELSAELEFKNNASLFLQIVQCITAVELTTQQGVYAEQYVSPETNANVIRYGIIQLLDYKFYFPLLTGMDVMTRFMDDNKVKLEEFFQALDNALGGNGNLHDAVEKRRAVTSASNPYPKVPEPKSWLTRLLGGGDEQQHQGRGL